MELVMNENDIAKRVRQMNKELRPLERRRNELIKMDRYQRLDKKDDAELMAIFDELSDKCSKNLEEILMLSGFR
jgi:hypothetical protein